MVGVLRESLLAEVDGDVAVFVAEPCEGSAEEEVNISHEVNFDVLGKFALE
jgi:hypothetical protein